MGPRLADYGLIQESYWVMNGPIVAIARELGFEGNSFLEGLVVSIFIAGAFIGSICSASFIDNFGCRRTLQIDTIPLILGALLSAQAHSLDEMLWGRFLVGLGIGLNTVLVPLYISEVSPTKHRGSLGTLCQIGTCLGIIAALSIGIPSESDPHWWRTILYIASAPGFILMFGMQFAVESPRWLCKVGRFDDAKGTIEKLWGESEVEESIKKIQSVSKNDDSNLETSWLELFVEPHNRVAFIGWSLFILQQFAGINGVLYFSSLTFQDVGITDGALASLFVGITHLAGALFALYLMDKQGRQRLLIGSYMGMACSMFLIVYAINFPQDEGLSHSLSVFGTIMYIFTFSIGAGPVTAIIIPELSGAQTRSKIMSLSFSIHWICNFLVGLFFLELVEKFGVGPVYAGFGAVSALSVAFAMYFIVETKGRSLEEIELSLNRNFPTEGK
ncbi:probable plastidic glucose transporter 1 isoform X2 [Elaeis guineensis]|uniref:Probable plastidic glucose transporter 1 isoform X2 n=1 Tax=Elaeis guineensis var. tenera TaxID=51953 RepID=A0A6I9QQF5_ELAGV|nr:probable plastidic glucose transporter 1 isoform X2 [Elaeis guineensis]